MDRLAGAASPRRLYFQQQHRHQVTRPGLVVNAPDEAIEVGFVRSAESGGVEFYEHPDGIFPRIALADEHAMNAPQVGLKVESIEAFIDAHRDRVLRRGITGKIGEPLRCARLHLADADSEVYLVERHGHNGFGLTQSGEYVFETAHSILTRFRTRSRSYEDPGSAFSDAEEIVQSSIESLNRDYVCDLFFRAEREYWQSRNLAARVQFERQQTLGLGWANHDHHTYRCSREWFAPLIRFLESLGMECRERFYAGKDAGWGAQVLEQPQTGIVVFADVDMSPAEVAGDFAHEGLSPAKQLGTVGLWCKLHGDSFFSAGMHHLECQFDFVAAQAQLADAGIETMSPFTDFPHLKQAFTKGERWTIPTERLEMLVAEGFISPEDRERFEKDGAIGSHLEILERNDGFKGFNQSGISDIILKTNPRRER